MSEAELWSVWRLWVIVAAAIVVVAAALLVTIWLTARSIAAHGRRALDAAERVRENTLPIWELKTSNDIAAGVLASVRSMEETGRRIATVLEGSPSGNRPR